MISSGAQCPYLGITVIQIIKNSKGGNIGISNMHKKYRRQDRDSRWVIYRLGAGDAVAFIFPLRRHANTSPIIALEYSADASQSKSSIQTLENLFRTLAQGIMPQNYHKSLCLLLQQKDVVHMFP